MECFRHGLINACNDTASLAVCSRVAAAAVLSHSHVAASPAAAGRSRRGPTLRECVLMHAVARLALHPHITNIQASWVKMGPQRAAQLLAGEGRGCAVGGQEDAWPMVVVQGS